jgi:hypothetical protein
MRADRTATLTCFRADRLPDVRAALVRKDFATALLPPIGAAPVFLGGA